MSLPGDVAPIRNRFRRYARFLEHTPLHPQWLVMPCKRGLTRWVAGRARGVVLDVGCGDGSMGKCVPAGSRYVGLDYPPTHDLGYPGRPAVFGDAACLPIASASIDTVLLLDVLEHLAEPRKALGEAWRVLRPGGRCLLHVPFAYPIHDAPFDYQRWTRFGLSREASIQGFQLVEVQGTRSSIESATANWVIALANGYLEAIARHRYWLVLLPAVAGIVCGANLCGWSLGRCLPGRELMPYSYRLELLRPEPDGG